MQSKKRPATRTSTRTTARRPATRDDDARSSVGGTRIDTPQTAASRAAPMSIASTVIARLLADRPPPPESPLDDVIARLVPGSAPLLDTPEPSPLELSLDAPR